MALATTYGDGNDLNREDLRDLLTVVEPEVTPVVTLLPKMKSPEAMQTDWGLDALNEPAYGAKPEGADVENHDNPAKKRKRIFNYHHKLQRTWSVSREQIKVSTAGVADEVANAKARSTKEIKRDIESLICGDNEMSSDNPTETRALGKFIQNTAQSVNPVPEEYRTPAASINTTTPSSLTDTNIGDVLQSVYEQTGEHASSFSLPCGPELRRRFTELQRVTGTSTTSLTYHVNQDASDHKIDLRVDEYITDFGSIFIIPTVFNGRASGDTALTNTSKRRGYLLNPECGGLSEFFPLSGYEQDDNGAGPRGYVEWMGGLIVKSPKKMAKFAA